MAGLRFIWPLIKTTSRWWGSCWGPAASWTFRMTWVLKLLEKSLWAVITTDLKSYTIFLTQLLVRFITGDFTWICFIFPVPCKDKTDRWRECFVNVSYFLSFISFFFSLPNIVVLFMIQKLTLPRRGRIEHCLFSLYSKSMTLFCVLCFAWPLASVAGCGLYTLCGETLC